jgi:Xaa-Pro dipeptidase
MQRVHELLTPSLYQTRIDALCEWAANQGLKATLFSEPSNIFYYTGFWGFSDLRSVWLVIPVAGSPTLIVPRLERSLAESMTRIADVRDWVEWSEPGAPTSWVEPLTRVLEEKRLRAGPLGIEAAYVTLDTFNTLRAKLAPAQLSDVSPVVANLRRRKSPVELEIMRAAGRVAEAQVEGARAVVAEGVPEYEVTLAARVAGTRKAADEIGPEFHHMSPLVTGVQILASGRERGYIVHARASTYRVQKGDIVQLCFCGPHFFLYNLGFDRPVPVSSPSRDQARLLDTALDAHDAAVRAVQPGGRACDVDAAAVRAIEEAGMLPYRMHRTGRSVGASRGEQPEIRDSDQTMLEPGMTFSVEPGIYMPGVGAARFGDTVAVTDDGVEILTAARYGWHDR